MFRVRHRGSVNCLSPPSGQEFHEQEVKPSHVRALRFPNILTAPLAIGNPFLRGICLWEGDGGAVWGAGATLTSDSFAALTLAHGFLVTNTWAGWLPSVLRTTSGGDIFMPHIYRQGHRRSVRGSHSPRTVQLGPGRLDKATGLAPGSDTTESPPYLLFFESPSRDGSEMAIRDKMLGFTQHAYVEALPPSVMACRGASRFT